MKKLAIFGVAAILTLPAAGMAKDGEAQKQEGKTVVASVAEENATVTAVDPKSRMITLRRSDGQEQTFVVDQRVKKLGQVHVGDTVKARYQEAVSVKINKTKVAPGVTVQTTVEPDKESVKPAGTAGMRVTTTATIERIYDDGKKVTLRMPRGTTADVRVRDPENLAKIKSGEVKEGDQIEITYKQAVALSVEKAPQK